MIKPHLWLHALWQRLRRLPEALRLARKQRRRDKVFAEGETERIDRIRHPWKYRGK